jgi:hypothetical protein
MTMTLMVSPSFLKIKIKWMFHHHHHHCHHCHHCHHHCHHHPNDGYATLRKCSRLTYGCFDNIITDLSIEYINSLYKIIYSHALGQIAY